MSCLSQKPYDGCKSAGGSGLISPADMQSMTYQQFAKRFRSQCKFRTNKPDPYEMYQIYENILHQMYLAGNISATDAAELVTKARGIVYPQSNQNNSRPRVLGNNGS